MFPNQLMGMVKYWEHIVSTTFVAPIENTLISQAGMVGTQRTAEKTVEMQKRCCTICEILVQRNHLNTLTCGLHLTLVIKVHDRRGGVARQRQLSGYRKSRVNLSR